MQTISDKEYYRAKFEYEELKEKTLNSGGTTESPTLTSAEQSLMAKYKETIDKYEQEEEEVFELDSIYWHEAGDRTDMVNMILQILLEHPAIAQTEELKDKVEQAQGLLYEVYQSAMNKSFELVKEELDEGEEEIPEVTSEAV